MKKINYKKLQIEAIRKNISFYLLIKRKLNYRKANKKNISCEYCLNKTKLNYIKMCKATGESMTKYSKIENNFVCDNFIKKNI